MKIIDIVNGPWAIRPAMLEEIQRIYSNHLHRAQKIDKSTFDAVINKAEVPGRPLNNSRNGSYCVDGVAVIPVQGVIGKKMNLFTQFCGGASTEAIGNDFITAINDPAITGIVLHIDSPGGTVDGTQQLADIIAQNKGCKPVVACADGMMCSAAYWIGSAADSINIADLTTDVGSIGVVASHMDISGWEEKQGIKTTEITAGKYKRAVSQYSALTDEGRAIIQADLDQIYSLFVDTVAANRGTTIDAVIANMADGRVFLGQKAIDAGLVDSVATLAETIQQVKQMSPAAAGRKRASAVRENETKKEPIMDIATLKAEHPELVQAIAAEATAGHAEALAAAKAEGAAAENQRIKDVRACLIPGHEALIESLAFDGKSTGADAALAIIGAEKKVREGAASVIDAEAPPVVPAIDADAGEQKSMKRADFNQLSLADQRAAVKSGTKITE